MKKQEQGVSNNDESEHGNEEDKPLLRISHPNEEEIQNHNDNGNKKDKGSNKEVETTSDEENKKKKGQKDNIRKALHTCIQS